MQTRIDEMLSTLSDDELLERLQHNDIDDLIPTDDFFDDIACYVGSFGDMNDFVDVLQRIGAGRNMMYVIEHPKLPRHKIFDDISDAIRYYRWAEDEYDYRHNEVRNAIKRRLASRV